MRLAKKLCIWSDYVIDTDPSDEVYEDYSLHGLMRIINQNKLKDFERLK